MMMVRAALWMIAVIASVGGERPDWMEEDEGAIVLLGGGVRTFLCAYDSVVNNLAAPLDADLFAYMKTREGTRGRPRPRALDDARIRVRLATYERFVGASLVERLSCDDECLLSLVGCRGRARKTSRAEGVCLAGLQRCKVCSGIVAGRRLCRAHSCNYGPAGWVQGTRCAFHLALCRRCTN